MRRRSIPIAAALALVAIPSLAHADVGAPTPIGSGMYVGTTQANCQINPKTGNPVIIGLISLTKPADYKTDFMDINIRLQGTQEDGQFGDITSGWVKWRTPDYARRKASTSRRATRGEGDDTFYGNSYRVRYRVRWRHTRYLHGHKLTDTTVYPTDRKWLEGVSAPCVMPPPAGTMTPADPYSPQVG